MSLRYRFIDLTSITDVSKLLEAAKLLPAAVLQGPSKPSLPLHNVFNRLKLIGAQTLLVQDAVRDPDFIAEHQAFYSKQHRPVARTCWRLHAFAVPVPMLTNPEGSARDVLDFLDALEDHDDAYLGFVTIRPLRHAPVGASILVPPKLPEVTCLEEFPVHIAGKDFKVYGTPYLQQDNAVGACAQASIWIALRTQMKRVGNTAYTPAELTLAATRYMALDRVFPGRQGLVIEQMLEAIRSSGHDPLTLTCQTGDLDPRLVIAEAMPYIESGLPVIATLFPPGGGHAVVCIGRAFKEGPIEPRTERLKNFEYHVASDWVDSLVMHNDNTGPYLSLASGAVESNDYCLQHARNLIIPLPETVHMTAREAEQAALTAVALAGAFLTQFNTTKTPQFFPDTRIVLRTFLVRRHTLRRWALTDSDIDPVLRDRYRTVELPRLIWFVELHDAQLFHPRDPSTKSRVGEVIVDASADSLHGDAALAVHVMQQMYPNHAGEGVPQALAAFVGTELDVLLLDSANTGTSMPTPWS